ncbi:zonular occludens toxin domain-containing protein [Psychrobacter sp. DM4]|uniref:zonular occludens toxin domain-containing protein n=1 Tax=Psychrobacter sp. DM4 TaxID=3440637 RepID=UPI003F4F5223
MSDNGLVKGQGLVLITGKKGSGKSHFATSQIKYIVDNHPEHKVYADIAGLNIAGVEPSPKDWQDLMDSNGVGNCTIFYDEAQRLEWADNSSTKINSDPRIREMTMIRHANINIVIITQDPTFVHSALRKLVDVHYHVSHPFKDGKPKVFKFTGAMSTIDDKGAYKEYATDTFTHKLDEETSKLYKSVDDGATHDQKKSIPKKVKIMIGVVVFLILVAIPAGIWGVGKVYGFIAGAEDRGDEMMNETTDNVETITGGSSSAPDLPTVDGLTDAELLALYKKYLDDYTVDVAEHDAIRPDSIMASGDKCMAFNMYGDGLNIPHDKCMSMLLNPETRPHKRTVQRAQSPQNSNFNSNASSNPVSSADDVDYINNPPPPIVDNS